MLESPGHPWLDAAARAGQRQVHPLLLLPEGRDLSREYHRPDWDYLAYVLRRWRRRRPRWLQRLVAKLAGPRVKGRRGSGEEIHRLPPNTHLGDPREPDGTPCGHYSSVARPAPGYRR